MSNYEPITNPILMPSRKGKRDGDVDLTQGQPKRDNYGKAIAGKKK